MEPSIEAFEDNDAGARRSVAWSRGQIGDTRAEGPLKKALGDGDSGAKVEASKSLDRMRNL